MNQFNLPLVMKVRRNHGLEHATIHVLGERTGFRSVAGYSTPAGFFLIGNFTAGEITLAVEDALRRLRNGEKHLAVHPGCGTNYVTSGLLAGTLALASAWFGADRRRSRVDQILKCGSRRHDRHHLRPGAGQVAASERDHVGRYERYEGPARHTGDGCAGARAFRGHGWRLAR